MGKHKKSDFGPGMHPTNQYNLMNGRIVSLGAQLEIIVRSLQMETPNYSSVQLTYQQIKYKLDHLRKTNKEIYLAKMANLKQEPKL